MVASPPTCSSSSRTRGHGAAEPSTPRPARVTVVPCALDRQAEACRHQHARASIACDHSSRPAEAVALAACLHRRRRRGSRGARACCPGSGAGRPELAPLLLLAAMGILSFQLREPSVTSRIGFSFLSIILLASGAILGPFGAWCVGLVSVAIDRDGKVRWFQRVFNPAMTAVVGVAGGWAYALSRGSEDLASLSGLDGHRDRARPAAAHRRRRAVHHQRAAPRPASSTSTRGFRSSSSCAGCSSARAWPTWATAPSASSSSSCGSRPSSAPFSAVLILAPLLAARWAFIQFGDELRSHERTVDTLVTALATKDPAAAERSLRVARLAEWVAEEMGLGPSQIGTVRYAAMLHEIGHLGVPTRLLRRPRALAQRRRAPGRRPPLRARGAHDRGHRLPRARAFGHPPPGRALRRPRHP